MIASRSLPQNIRPWTKKVGAPNTPRFRASSVFARKASLAGVSPASASSRVASSPSSEQTAATIAGLHRYRGRTRRAAAAKHRAEQKGSPAEPGTHTRGQRLDSGRCEIRVGACRVPEEFDGCVTHNRLRHGQRDDRSPDARERGRNAAPGDRCCADKPLAVARCRQVTIRCTRVRSLSRSTPPRNRRAQRKRAHARLGLRQMYLAAAGAIYPFDRYCLTELQIIDLARQWDRQRFHLDKGADVYSKVVALMRRPWCMCRTREAQRLLPLQ